MCYITHMLAIICTLTDSGTIRVQLWPVAPAAHTLRKLEPLFPANHNLSMRIQTYSCHEFVPMLGQGLQYTRLRQAPSPTGYASGPPHHNVLQTILIRQHT